MRRKSPTFLLNRPFFFFFFNFLQPYYFHEYWQNEIGVSHVAILDCAELHYSVTPLPCYAITLGTRQKNTCCEKKSLNQTKEIMKRHHDVQAL